MSIVSSSFYRKPSILYHKRKVHIYNIIHSVTLSFLYAKFSKLIFDQITVQNNNNRGFWLSVYFANSRTTLSENLMLVMAWKYIGRGNVRSLNRLHWILKEWCELTMCNIIKHDWLQYNIHPPSLCIYLLNFLSVC